MLGLDIKNSWLYHKEERANASNRELAGIKERGRSRCPEKKRMTEREAERERQRERARERSSQFEVYFWGMSYLYYHYIYYDSYIFANKYLMLQDHV